MKKYLISLISIFFFASVFYNPVLAQTGGITVATVNVYNAKIVSQDDRNFTLSFDISNKTGVQPEIMYGVRLTKISSTTDITVDEKVYDDTFSLGENSSTTKTISYNVPDSISAGIYKLWIDSKNSSGLPLGIAFIGDVKIASSTKNTVEIVPGSCYVMVDGNRFDLNRIFISPSDSPVLKCEVVSTFPLEITVNKNIVTRSSSSFGDVVSAVGTSTGGLVLKNGINYLDLSLPHTIKPQVYNLSFNLLFSNEVSNTISFNYTLIGESGVIKNVVFDKSSYKIGDTAHLQIFSNQTGTSTVSVLIINDSNLACSATSSQSVLSSSVFNLSIPITKECLRPKANISIFTEKGNILYSDNFQLAGTSTVAVFNSEVFYSIALIIFMLILSIVFYKRRDLKRYFRHRTLLFTLFSLSIFFSFNIVSVNAAVNIYASSSVVLNGASTTISWNSIGDRSCSVTRSDIGSVWQTSGTSFIPSLQVSGLSLPSGSVVDSFGNIYVVDAGIKSNTRDPAITKIKPSNL